MILNSIILNSFNNVNFGKKRYGSQRQMHKKETIGVLNQLEEDRFEKEILNNKQETEEIIKKVSDYERMVIESASEFFKNHYDFDAIVTSLAEKSIWQNNEHFISINDTNTSTPITLACRMDDEGNTPTDYISKESLIAIMNTLYTSLEQKLSTQKSFEKVIKKLS